MQLIFKDLRSLINTFSFWKNIFDIIKTIQIMVGQQSEFIINQVVDDKLMYFLSNLVTNLRVFGNRLHDFFHTVS